jgi:hypothetical protein
VARRPTSYKAAVEEFPALKRKTAAAVSISGRAVHPTKNSGSTCFANAVVQMLLNTAPPGGVVQV